MTTSTTKSWLIDEENSRATLIQPAQNDVGPYNSVCTHVYNTLVCVGVQ